MVIWQKIVNITNNFVSIWNIDIADISCNCSTCPKTDSNPSLPLLKPTLIGTPQNCDVHKNWLQYTTPCIPSLKWMARSPGFAVTTNMVQTTNRNWHEMLLFSFLSLIQCFTYPSFILLFVNRLGGRWAREESIVRGGGGRLLQQAWWRHKRLWRQGSGVADQWQPTEGVVYYFISSVIV